jgi:fructokinase
MKRYVVGLGEILWDCLPEGKKLGGAPANFAFHAGLLGADSIAVSAIGQDALGDEILRELDEKGLKYLMPRTEQPTGTVEVTLDGEGIPTYDIKTGVAWDNIPLLSEMVELAEKCNCVCFGSLAQRSEVSRNTIRKFLRHTPDDCLRIFDINLRQKFYTKELIHENLLACNVLKINDEELDVVTEFFALPTMSVEERCRRLLEDYDLKSVILTCGVNGSYVFTSNEKSFLETPKVEVADTVGAGDSFTGAFAASILAGHTIHEAHQLAVRVSAYVCTKKGAMHTFPHRIG